MANPSIWPTLTYADAPTALTWLVEAFGFQLTAAHRHPDDDGHVVHAELRWPEGCGGIMLGSAAKDESPYGRRIPGNDSVYVVCADPDELFVRATAAGAEVVRPLTDEDYGSRGFVVKDPEGNLWAFGTYEGE